MSKTKTFTFTLKVEAPVCDDSPGFPEHSYALDWLCSQLKTAEVNSHMSILDTMTKAKGKPSKVDEAVIKACERDIEMIKKVYTTIRVKE